MNEKVLVVYNSVDGSTKCYAEWIAYVLNCNIVNYDDLSKRTLAKYDTIIFGSCVRMGVIAQLDKMRKKMQKLSVELVVFAVGMIRATENNVLHIANKNSFISGDKLFYMKGEFNLVTRHRNYEVAMLSKIVASMQRSKVPLNSTETYLIECCETPHDWRNPQNIKPIIRLIDAELLAKVDEIEFVPNDYTEYLNRPPVEKPVYHYHIGRR